jgi:hypothetical protein
VVRSVSRWVACNTISSLLQHDDLPSLFPIGSLGALFDQRSLLDYIHRWNIDLLALVEMKNPIVLHNGHGTALDGNLHLGRAHHATRRTCREINDRYSRICWRQPSKALDPILKNAV